MNLDLAFLVFCLTVIAIIAILNGNNELANTIAGALANLVQETLRIVKRISGNK